MIGKLAHAARCCASAAGAHAIAWKLRKLDFDIGRDDLVLDVGSGAAPNPYADVLVEFDPAGHQTNAGPAAANGKALVWADVQKLPFRDRVFDYALCFHVLEHVERPDACLRELQRVAKRGYIETPNEMFDIVVPYRDHRNRVSFDGERLRVVRKGHWDVDRFEQRYGRRRSEQVLGLLLRDPTQLHVQYRWSDRIEWLYDPAQTITDGSASADSAVASHDGQIASQWVNTLATRLIRRPPITMERLISILRCVACSSGEIECASDDAPARCTVCGRLYERVNGFLDFR